MLIGIALFWLLIIFIILLVVILFFLLKYKLEDYIDVDLLFSIIGLFLLFGAFFGLFRLSDSNYFHNIKMINQNESDLKLRSYFFFGKIGRASCRERV